MEAAAAGLALGTTGLFTGGVLFISAIEFPAALKYSYKAFYDYFSDMYPRGFKLQGSFLFVGIHAAAVAAAKATDKHNRMLWSLSSALLFAILPYTMVVLMPTTRRILRQEETDAGKHPALRRKWGRLHHGRTVLAMSAFAAMIAAVVCGRGSS